MSAAGTYQIGSHTVDRAGYGALQLAGPGAFGQPSDRAEALRVLREAIALGINHIDTADYYGPGVVNELIREALHPYPDDLAIVSKVGWVRDEAGGIHPSSDPAALYAAIEQNLRTLRIDRLAAVNLRLANSSAAADARFDAQLEAMVAARDAGLIAGVGLSNVGPAQLRRALEVTDIVSVQNSLNWLDTSSVELLDETRRLGIAFAPFSPLGFPRSRHLEMVNDPVVASHARRYGVTGEQLLLAWLLALGPHVLLIAGTSSVEHLRENHAAADVRLDDETRAELDAIWRRRAAE